MPSGHNQKMPIEFGCTFSRVFCYSCENASYGMARRLQHSLLLELTCNSQETSSHLLIRSRTIHYSLSLSPNHIRSVCSPGSRSKTENQLLHYQSTAYMNKCLLKVNAPLKRNNPYEGKIININIDGVSRTVFVNILKHVISLTT